MKILAVEWRASGFAQVGVVAIETGSGGWKAYIGAPLNLQEQSDALFIANHGAPLLEKEARAFFPQLEGKAYDA